MRSEAQWENEICTAIVTGRKIIWGYILYNYTVTVTGKKIILGFFFTVVLGNFSGRDCTQ